MTQEFRGAALAAIPNAKVTLKSQSSAYSQETHTNNTGEFIFTAVPGRAYNMKVEQEGSSTLSQPLNVAIGSAPNVELSMSVSTVTSSADVTAPLEITNPDSSHCPVTVEELEIQHTLGADRTTSLAGKRIVRWTRTAALLLLLVASLQLGVCAAGSTCEASSTHSASGLDDDHCLCCAACLGFPPGIELSASDLAEALSPPLRTDPLQPDLRSIYHPPRS